MNMNFEEELKYLTDAIVDSDCREERRYYVNRLLYLIINKVELDFISKLNGIAYKY